MRKLFLFALLCVITGVASVLAFNTGTPGKKKLDTKQMIADVKHLAKDEFKGRRVGTPENKRAREYIVARFAKLKLDKYGESFLQEFSFKRQDKQYDAANVVGFVKGKTHPDKYIVITAHFDHVGVNKGQIYNGADDNASGTAALMAFAKYFKKKRPQTSMIFAALDAEEGGLRGARHFVENPPVAKEKILMNVNMDMISRSDKNELYVAGTYHYPQFKELVAEAAKKAPVKLLMGHDRPELKSNDWTFQSDHGAFHRKKIPFLYFGVEDHPDYHKPTDDFEKIDQTFYANSAKSVLMVLKALDKKMPKAKSK